MIEISDKKRCMGCTACESICPENAIYMEQDEEGFFYPKVDKQKCIDCGSCDEVCPMNNYDKENSEKVLALGAWSYDLKNKEVSSSGGCFGEFSKYILNLNGVVVGAVFNENQDVVHQIIENEDDLIKLKGSKYVQSNMSLVYKKVEAELENDRYVLFSGTPCQVAGLYNYLKADDEKLYTLDLVCHGVPSIKVLKKNIKEIELGKGQKVKEVCFRNKKDGWKKYCTKVIFDNDSEVYIDRKNDHFRKAFLKNICLRPACYECKFSHIPRIADISLGDFWGVEHKYPELDDDKGTSLLLVNTKKGLDILEACKDMIFTQEIDLDYAISCNPCIVKSVAPHEYRKEFFENLDKYPLNKLQKLYFPNESIMSKIKKLFIRVINKFKKEFRKIIK